MDRGERTKKTPELDTMALERAALDYLARYATSAAGLRRVVGTVLRDQRAGLVGSLGTEPPLLPVEVTVARDDGEAGYSFAVAEDPVMTPALVFWCLYNALLVRGDDSYTGPVYGYFASFAAIGNFPHAAMSCEMSCRWSLPPSIKT